MKSAARWAEGGRATADGKMMVRSSETVNVAVAGDWGYSEARGCCSGQRTPGGGMTQTHLQLHLKDKVKRNNNNKERELRFILLGEFSVSDCSNTQNILIWLT